MKSLRLPRSVQLPFGRRIKIVQVPEAQLTDLFGVSDGQWHITSQTIYVNKALGQAKKRYVVAHELQHALVDYLHMLQVEGEAQP